MSSSAGLASSDQEFLAVAQEYIGAMEIGILVSVCLFGTMLVQLYNYAQSHRSEPWTLHALVSWICLLETAHTVLLCYYLYSVTVFDFGLFLAIDIPSKQYCISIALSGMIGGCVQSFFAYRTFVISRRLWMALPSWLGSVARIGLSLWLTIIAVRSSSLIYFESQRKVVVVMLLLVSFVVDVINTGVFCVFLAAHRSGFSRTSRVVDRLIIWSIETGAVSCVCALVIIVLWFGDQYSYTFGFISIYGKIYSNSLLISLNSRDKLRGALGGGEMDHRSDAECRSVPALLVSLAPSRPDAEVPPPSARPELPRTQRGDKERPSSRAPLEWEGRRVAPLSLDLQRSEDAMSKALEEDHSD